MARRRRISHPPVTGDESLDGWLRQATDALNQLPSFSISSTTDGPNTSGVSGNSGTLLIDVGSSATTFWFKETDSAITQGWSHVSFL